MKLETSAKWTLWVNRIIAAAVAVLCFAMPHLLEWYQQQRSLGPHGAAAIFIGFYLCVPAVFFALASIDRTVRNLLAQRIFVAENVRLIRRLRWCCAAVSLICLPAAYFYPPLIFMAVIMAFLALVVSLVKNVMAAAVAIREENDLTI